MDQSSSHLNKAKKAWLSNRSCLYINIDPNPSHKVSMGFSLQPYPLPRTTIPAK